MRRMNKKAKIFVLDILLFCFLAISIYSGFRLYKETADYKKGRESYKEIQEKVLLPDNDSGSKKILLDYELLKRINSDFVGWIYLEDSSINYPFVQTDNNEFYLYHLFDRSYNKSGCVFIDAENQKDFSDKNTILYAHHMKNGTMFHDIVKYENQDYYDSHKVIHISTVDSEYVVYPIAGFYTTGFDDYLKIHFEDNEEFIEYVEKFRAESTFVSEETITEDDQIVLFSTCAYNVANGRYALIGKLVKVGEQTDEMSQHIWQGRSAAMLHSLIGKSI